MNNKTSTGTMSLFASSPEKGSREWNLAHPVKHDHTPGSYRVALPRTVHVRIRPTAPHYQEFFILKNAL
jgi:hypothetical protein